MILAKQTMIRESDNSDILIRNSIIMSKSGACMEAEEDLPPLSPGQQSPRSPLEVIEECECECMTAPSKTQQPIVVKSDQQSHLPHQEQQPQPLPEETTVTNKAEIEELSNDCTQAVVLEVGGDNSDDASGSGAASCSETASPEQAASPEKTPSPAQPPAPMPSVWSPSSSEKKRSPTRVSFANIVQYKEIRHIKDYTPNEVASIWNTPADYQLIKGIVKRTVAAMMKGETIPEDDVNFCTRGLEFRTRVGSKIRSRNKLRARSAVLNEQDLQRDEGFSDPHFIAMACMEESLETRQGARARGLYDEEMNKAYMADARAAFGHLL